MLAALRSTSGRAGSAQPSWFAHTNLPVALGERSRQTVSPMFVENTTGESNALMLRTVHGTRTSTNGSTTQPSAFKARRQPAPVASTASTNATRNGSENGRTRLETPNTAPNRSNRLRVGGPTDQSCVARTVRLASAKKMKAVSRLRVATKNTRFGNTAAMAAATSATRTSSPNARRAMTKIMTTEAVPNATLSRPAAMAGAMGRWECSTNQNNAPRIDGYPTG